MLGFWRTNSTKHTKILRSENFVLTNMNIVCYSLCMDFGLRQNNIIGIGCSGLFCNGVVFCKLASRCSSVIAVVYNGSHDRYYNDETDHNRN